MDIFIPYGPTSLRATIPDHVEVDFIEPKVFEPVRDPIQVVQDSLLLPVGDVPWDSFSGVRKVGIAVNDKTRPVPHHDLLPPLMERLESLGIPDESITFYIAVGSHSPMKPDEFTAVLPPTILSRYKAISHDSEAEHGLIHLGKTRRGTEVWVNEEYFHSDLKIVVGNIEPHQFMGFSGGVKSVAIGLAGLGTIRQNHAMMTLADSELGVYETNPARQDVEEIGKMIGVHLAVNAILTQEKKLLYAICGEPRQVMEKGILLARQVCQVAVKEKYPLVIASPGGHPKDIDVYQAQKGMHHAARVLLPWGTMILAAACPEESGSPHYENWMVGKHSHHDVMQAFREEGFRIGPHKAYLIARDALQFRLLWFSQMDRKTANSLLLNLVDDFQAAVDLAVADLKSGERIGIFPHAASTIPYLDLDSGNG